MTAVPKYPEPATSPIAAEPVGAVALLNNITKRYANGVLALDSLSLAIGRSEIVALLGRTERVSPQPSSCHGLSSPTVGTVRIVGADPRQTAARLRTGVMLQMGKAPEMLRVREHIELFRGYYPNPMLYRDILEVAGLEAIEARMFGQLSDGQKQRVLFALALAGDPDLIFLDEPTVGFDIHARRGMWAQIRSLAARGKTVLLTTHYLEEADALAHRIIVINKGRVVGAGTPTEIKSLGSRAPGASASHGLKIIRCATTLPTLSLLSIPGVIRAQNNDNLVTLTSTQPESTLRELLALDQTLHSLEVRSPALEDAFLALTSQRQSPPL
jgi:ABC-2 type transport system ATP-binding protein